MKVVFEPQDRCQSTLECRDRELANLRSLLRSVTGKLEKAHDMLNGDNRGEWQVQQLIESVLEVLS